MSAALHRHAATSALLLVSPACGEEQVDQPTCRRSSPFPTARACSGQLSLPGRTGGSSLAESATSATNREGESLPARRRGSPIRQRCACPCALRSGVQIGHRAALLCRDCESRRCACCRPDPRRTASAPRSRSRGRAATLADADLAPGPDDRQELRTGHGTGFQLPVRAGKAGAYRRAGSCLRASGRSATALLLGGQRSDAAGANRRSRTTGVE
jgi:hypothetical protein